MIVEKRYQIASLVPRPESTDSQARRFREAPACIWLWAWPHLFGWHKPVHWLFSSGTGNKPGRGSARPGDRWGVDASGDLIIVEAKACAVGGDLPDPFVNFLGLAKLLVTDQCPDSYADSLENQCSAQLNQERRFIENTKSICRQAYLWSTSIPAYCRTGKSGLL